MPDVVDVSHRQLAGTVRDWMAAIRDSEDLVNVGAYVEGSNPRIDQARARQGAIDGFLRQPAESLGSFAETLEALRAL
jgi:flagellar biosynthesis/type III secretory pathway ATPase